MQKTLEYYIVVGSDDAPCGHLHPDYLEASACPHRRSAGRILRLQPAQEARARSSDLVHPTAIVAASARIGADVRIGPYAIVGEDVVVGRGSALGAHSILRAGTVIGRRTVIDSLSVVGGDPQDASFDPEIPSGVVVGDQVVLREGVTVHRSTKPGGMTSIGDDATLMAHSHVGHDGVVGPNAILANNVLLGGRVEVGAHAFLGGGTGVHQHVRVGESSMIGGNASITHDVPPFTLATGRNRVHGLNVVGLRRRQLPEPVITDLKRCYRAVFSGLTDLRQNAAVALSAGECGGTDPGRRLLEFFAAGVRGFARPIARN